MQKISPSSIHIIKGLRTCGDVYIYIFLLSVVKRKGEKEKKRSSGKHAPDVGIKFSILCIFTKNKGLNCIQLNIGEQVFVNNCILFLFMYYTALLLFWNQGCNIQSTLIFFKLPVEEKLAILILHTPV